MIDYIDLPSSVKSKTPAVRASEYGFCVIPAFAETLYFSFHKNNS